MTHKTAKKKLSKLNKRVTLVGVRVVQGDKFNIYSGGYHPPKVI